MPQFSNAPRKMNLQMHKVYISARLSGKDKATASRIAIGVAKKKFKKKGGLWLGKK